MKNIGWYFPVENNPSDRYVDEFADSKFSTDRWASFTREIIQNSLDVADSSLDPHMPVLVKMNYKILTKEMIPGCDQLEASISRAVEGAISKKSNKQTINRYQKALELIASNCIPCLKVSDYMTLGVKSGRDNEWGALVYDEGKSCKNRPGSAGSHGVGKKAPFIISALNTVFYSTYNKANEFLFQGKTSLINWDDEDGITRNGKGWYGIIDNENDDRKKKITNLSNEQKPIIDDFFTRNNEYGTDVTIVGVLLNDLDKIKERIINSVLENFFIAIKNHQLSLEIFGEYISDDNLDECVQKYYITNQRNFIRQEGIEKSVFGNLLNYYKAYSEAPITFDVSANGVRYGKCYVYLSLENDKNRKYYCIFRNHGMKICDVDLSNAEQPFSAVVYLDDCPEDNLPLEERLNARLSDVENAAHDTFVTDDEEFKCDPITKILVDNIYSNVKNIILDKTKIEATEETPLEGLDDMLAIQGILTTKLTAKKVAIKKRKNRIKKKSTGKRADDYEQGVTAIGGSDVEKKHKHNGEHKPAMEGDDFKATLFKKFAFEPRFVRTGETYNLILKPTENAMADIRIMPISVEGTLNYIPNVITSAKSGSLELKVEDNVIKNVALRKDIRTSVTITILNNYDYALECDVFVGGNSDD